MKKLSVIFSAFLVFLFAACDMGIEEIKRFSELEYIKVDASEAKKSYLEGESFLSDGIKVYGYYTDNTVKEVDLKRVDFSGFPGKDEIQEIEMETDIPITVSMGEFSDSFNIRFVKKTITGITATLTQNLYLVGEDFDYSKIVVRPTYSDNTIGIPLNAGDFTVDGFISADVNSRLPLKVKYKTFETEVYVMIFNGIFEEILVYAPSKKIYTKTEKFDPTGMIVQGKYNNNYSLITVYKIEIVNHEELSDIDQLPPGNYDIVISVNSIKSDPFTIRILDKYQTGIALAEGQEVTPRNKVYKQGDKFFIKDFKFAKLLSDGSLGDEIPTGELSSTMDDQVLTEKGIIPVTVTAEYEDIVTFTTKTASCSFDICVGMPKIERIEAVYSLKGTNATIPLGITPDNEDYVSWDVKGIPSFGEGITIPARYCSFEYVNEENLSYSQESMAIEATEDKQIKKKVKVTYFEGNGNTLSTQTEVNVGLPVITSVELVSSPNTILFQGQQVSLAGTVVKLMDSTGGESKRIEYDKTSNAFEIENLNSIDTNKPDIYKVIINVKHDEFHGVTYSFSFYVTVKPDSPVSLTVSKKSDIPTSYRLGKEYSKIDFFKNFRIQENYYNENHHEEIPENKMENLSYRLIENKNENYRGFTDNNIADNIFSKSGVLEVLYKTSHYVSNGHTQEDITVSGYCETSKLRLLPPCPKFATVNLTNPTSNLLDSLKTDKADYKITCTNGDEVTFKGNEFSNGVEKYCVNGFYYSLKVSENEIKLTYEAKNKDLTEDSAPAGELSLIKINFDEQYNIHSMAIVPKEDCPERDKRKFFLEKLQNNSNAYKYNLGNYFKLQVTYLTGHTKELTSSEVSINWGYDADSECITAEYLGHKAYYGDITVLKPMSLEISTYGLHWNSSDTKYKFTNESGIESEVPGDRIESEVPGDSINVTISGQDSIYYRLTSSPDIEEETKVYTTNTYQDRITGITQKEDNDVFEIQQTNNPNWLKNYVQFHWFFKDKQDVDEAYYNDFTVVDKDNFAEEVHVNYSNADDILRLSEGGKNVLIRYLKVDDNEYYSLEAKILPAIPNSGAKEGNRESDNRKIVFSYSSENTDITKEESYSALRDCGFIKFYKQDGMELDGNGPSRFDADYIMLTWSDSHINLNQDNGGNE